MKPVTDPYCFRMGIHCCRRISGRPIPGYDLYVRKCCEPAADISSLSGRDHVDYPMALKVDHNRTIREPFPKCKIIHTVLFYRSFIHNGGHFFKQTADAALAHNDIFAFQKLWGIQWTQLRRSMDNVFDQPVCLLCFWCSKRMFFSKCFMRAFWVITEEFSFIYYKMTRLSWIGRSWISLWYAEWTYMLFEPQNGHTNSFLLDLIWKTTSLFLMWYCTNS